MAIILYIDWLNNVPDFTAMLTHTILFLIKPGYLIKYTFKVLYVIQIF